MNERTYLQAIADEIIKMDNPRVKAILAWTTEIEHRIDSCSRVEADQKLQAASATSEIILEMNRAEAMRDSAFPHFHPTTLNTRDRYIAQYFYRLNFEKREITLDVAIVNTNGMSKSNHWKFEPITVPMREEAA